MTSYGCDYAFSHPDPAGLRAAGYEWTLRYVFAGSIPKHLTATELQALHAAGLGVGLLCELTSLDAGQELGRFNAVGSRHTANVLGFPDDSVIWYAVDRDVTIDTLRPAIDYFQGINQVQIPWQIGCYGDTDICQALKDLNLASSFFKPAATSWSHGGFPYNIVQTLNGQPVAGGVIDRCVAPEYPRGIWRPAMTTPSVPFTEEDHENLYAVASMLRALRDGLPNSYEVNPNGAPFARDLTLLRQVLGGGDGTATDAQVEAALTTVLNRTGLVVGP